jgi:tetratricopeptide (TPR) repeat protein
MKKKSKEIFKMIQRLILANNKARRRHLLGLIFSLSFFFWSCTGGSARNQYLLAERLWTEGQYSAAVNEFEKVIERDTYGELGQQALFRAAMTEYLFLSRYSEAIAKFELFLVRTNDVQLAFFAKREMAEILFTHLSAFSQAERIYRELLENPLSPEDRALFLYRIAKSLFFLQDFEQAISYFEKVEAQHPESEWAEKAAYEIGVAYFTGGEHQPEPGSPERSVYEKSIESFESFLAKYPESSLTAEARFGIASCYEELDQLDQAYRRYAAIKNIYPSPKVIEIKLIRIRERQKDRNR